MQSAIGHYDVRNSTHHLPLAIISEILLTLLFSPELIQLILERSVRLSSFSLWDHDEHLAQHETTSQSYLDPRACLFGPGNIVLQDRDELLRSVPRQLAVEARNVILLRLRVNQAFSFVGVTVVSLLQEKPRSVLIEQVQPHLRTHLSIGVQLPQPLSLFSMPRTQYTIVGFQTFEFRLLVLDLALNLLFVLAEILHHLSQFSVGFYETQCISWQAFRRIWVLTNPSSSS